MNKADVTIIVPIYNVEKYVEKCIRSLLSQTFKNIQILAVDDGSPDNSKDIIRKLSKKDDRVKLVVKENGGYGSVLQYAIKNIQTEYFIVCDPDDWLRKDAVEKLYNFSRSNKLDICIADRYDVFSNGQETVAVKVVPEWTQIMPKKVYSKRNEISLFSFCSGSPHAKIFKTNIMKKINFPKKISFTDFILYVVGLAHAKRVAYLNEPLAYYLKDRAGNSMTNTSIEKMNDYLLMWNSAFNQINSIDQNEIFLFRLYNQLQLTLVEYKKLSRTPFHDEYTVQIYHMISKMQTVKTKLKSVRLGDINFLTRLVLLGLMNPSLYKIFAKLYVRLK